MPLRDRIRHAATPRRLFIAAAGLAGFGVLMELTGGFDVRPYGIRISAHGALRPLLLAILTGAAGFRLLADDEQERVIDRGAGVFGRLVWIVPVAAALVVLWLGLTRGVRSAGGSDIYGYISQSKLWLKGDLHVRQPFVASMPWPNADWTFTPLGYRGSDAHDYSLLPTYAPGLPMLMALLTLVVGNCGPYLIGPICGALFVALTYELGRRVSGPVVGAIAALSAASSPIVLFMALQPMSDIPVATFWTAAVVVACRRTTVSAAAAGLAAGVALVIRPNLLPLALFPAAIAAWPEAGRRWRALVRLLVYGAAAAPFALFVGWLFNHLYGSPLTSGYGDPGFHWEHFRANIANYPTWLGETQGPLIWLFAASVLLSWRPAPGALPLRPILLAMMAAVLGCYLWYLPFENWPYLRFLLPGFPALFVLGADAAWNLSAGAGRRVRVIAGLSFCLISLNYAITRAREMDVVGIGRGEQKYADVGRYIDRHLPANAVVFAMQHSGSIRYYSGRPTLRYDELDADWLDRALAHLEATGMEPYVVLEEWEVPRFRERFAGQSRAGLLDHPAIATEGEGRVFLYSARRFPAPGTKPEAMPHTSGCQ
jgi:hypothetical protein